MISEKFEDEKLDDDEGEAIRKVTSISLLEKHYGNEFKNYKK